MLGQEVMVLGEVDEMVVSEEAEMVATVKIREDGHEAEKEVPVREVVVEVLMEIEMVAFEEEVVEAEMTADLETEVEVVVVDLKEMNLKMDHGKDQDLVPVARVVVMNNEISVGEAVETSEAGEVATSVVEEAVGTLEAGEEATLVVEVAVEVDIAVVMVLPQSLLNAQSTYD